MKKVIKFIVSDIAFQDAIHLPCYKIAYLDSSEIDSLVKFDFILISDKDGNEVIRNFMKAGEKILEYTSCFDGDRCDDISLTVIMTFLYQSIMWIRHGTYIQKKLFANSNFPVRRLEQELYFIDSVLKLCEGKIDMNDFIRILEQYEKGKNDFVYFSALDILDKYAWKFDLTDIRKEKIELISGAIVKIYDLLKDKSKWKEIYKVGYKIHNEPHFIFENSKEF